MRALRSHSYILGTGAIIWLLIGSGCGYNQLQGLDEQVKAAWAEVQNQYQRRADLIPNLVEVVKGYAKHERETMEEVIKLRNLCAADSGSVSHQEGTERRLVGAVQKLLAVAEAYPELKANGNFLELQHELVNTEDRIQAARRFYNGNVRDYRNKCETFSSNLVANMFGFQLEEFFSVPPSVREVPNVEFAN